MQVFKNQSKKYDRERIFIHWNVKIYFKKGCIRTITID